MFHALKKTVNVYKPAEKTTDPVFDDMHAKFKNAMVQGNSMYTAMKANRTSWDSFTKNAKEILDTAVKSCDEGATWTKENAGKALKEVNRWDKKRTEGMEAKEKEGLPAAVRAEMLLEKYTEFCTQTQKKVLQRQDVVTELDYYRAKADKKRNDPKEADSLSRAEAKVSELMDQLDTLSAEIYAEMEKAVEMKDSVVAAAFSGYMLTQQQYLEGLNNFAHGSDVMPMDQWPKESDFKVTAASRRPSKLSNHSSSKELKTSASVSRTPSAKANSGPTSVRALYDNTTSAYDELAFRAGDVITNVVAVDENWYKGRLRGKEGIFPRNYVEPA
eukprot:comp7226_c0_seq1/m.2938 comp7226_c0_seq1/g.2938  ORF comp7226_c0_seq1/g.2938 comp7226_c0_seq1/m.2938 type:complete len:330 (-) comp7226_c0_seq1:95-1084(-)